MCKSPYPLLDWIMVGPLLAFANIYFGSPLPEIYVAIALAVSVVIIIIPLSSRILWNLTAPVTHVCVWIGN